MKKVILFKVVTEELLIHENIGHVNLHSIPFEICEDVAGTHGEEIAHLASYKTFEVPIRKHMRRTELTHEYLALCNKSHMFWHPEEGYTTEETYIAIDPAAERVLDVEINEMVRLREECHILHLQIGRLQNENDGYETVVSTFKSAGFFTILKWLFRGVSV